MYPATIQRRLHKNATTVLIGGIFLFLSVVLYLSLCASPCEVYTDPVSLQDDNQPVWNRKSNLRKKKTNAYLVVLVMTGPKYFERRKSIRKTWLSNLPPDVKSYFVIGILGLSPEEKETLEYEHKQHDDLMLLPNLVDSYTNLTTKVLESMVWVSNNMDAQYVFKADDDTYARLDVIVNELKTDNPVRFYWGFFYGKGHVYKTGKWAEQSWVLCDRYLPYARGGGYLLSNDLVQYLSMNSKLLKKYNNEDISVGAWLAPLELNRKHDTRFDTEYKSRGCNNAYIVTHKQDTNQMIEKHKNILENGKLCKTEFRELVSYIYNWEAPPSECCVRNNPAIP